MLSHVKYLPMNLSHYTFSLPPRQVPFSRMIVTLLGPIFLQVFVWGWIAFTMVMAGSVNWDNIMLHPLAIDFDIIAHATAKGVLTGIEPAIKPDSPKEETTYAYRYGYTVDGNHFQGVSYSEDTTCQLGQSVWVRYREGDPAVSCIDRMRSRPGEPTAILGFFLFSLIGILGLVTFTWWNLNQDYLIRHGHFARGTFVGECEDKNSDGDTIYKVEYSFQASDQQVYPAEEILYEPVNLVNIELFVLYQADRPQNHLILKLPAYQEDFDEHFQPLPASWDTVFFHSFIPAGVIIGIVCAYLYH